MSTRTDVEQRKPEVTPPEVSAAEFERLKLDRFKAKLDFWKFVLGSVFAALAIAAIPPSFQLATAYLEREKAAAQLRAEQYNKEADRDQKAEEFRQNNIKSFITEAVNQDIELRLRFADYFSFVSPEARDKWETYRDHLKSIRDEVRGDIDRLENEWAFETSKPKKDFAKIAGIQRNLEWRYKEVGYVERDRSVSTNPRALALSRNQESLNVIQRSQRLTQASDATLIALLSIPAPIQDNARIAKMSVGECVPPDDEFAHRLKKATMLVGQGEVEMLKELWDKANADITEIKSALPDLYSKLYVANKPICVRKLTVPQGSEQKDLVLTPGKELELYLDQADVSGDVGSWEQQKVDDYRRLVGYMNSRGWYWMYLPSYDYSFHGAFYPSDSLVSELRRQ